MNFMKKVLHADLRKQFIIHNKFDYKCILSLYVTILDTIHGTDLVEFNQGSG